jgi:hypothetical protein
MQAASFAPSPATELQPKEFRRTEIPSGCIQAKLWAGRSAGYGNEGHQRGGANTTFKIDA